MTKQRFITTFSAITRNNPRVGRVNTLTVIRRTLFHQEPWMITIATSWHFNHHHHPDASVKLLRVSTIYLGSMVIGGLHSDGRHLAWSRGNTDSP